MINRQSNQTQGKVHDLVGKHGRDIPVKAGTKRGRYLALLKSRYGYTNEKALEELERLLRQFYRTNRSLSIHRGSKKE